MSSVATTSIENITPEDAVRYLERNTQNRVLNKLIVSKLADAMVEGRWTFTGESIVFDENGVVVDGQHRLTGCVLGGVPFTTVVVRSAPKEAFRDTGSGKPRTNSDLLYLLGVKKNSTLIAAAVKLAILYRAGALPKHGGGVGSTIAHKAAIETEYERNPTLWEFAGSMSNNRAKRQSFTPSAFAAFYVLLHEYADDDTIEKFIEPLLTGENLATGNPCLACRSWFIGAGRGAPGSPALSVLIKSWNAWLSDETRAHLSAWGGRGEFPQFATPSPHQLHRIFHTVPAQ